VIKRLIKNENIGDMPPAPNTSSLCSSLHCEQCIIPFVENGNKSKKQKNENRKRKNRWRGPVTSRISSKNRKRERGHRSTWTCMLTMWRNYLPGSIGHQAHRVASKWRRATIIASRPIFRRICYNVLKKI